VSHVEERKEKDCLNCGAIVQGRFCHVCGQENTVPHETFWHMVKHFFYDITHFDSKFFDSLKYLVLRPGFLSKEYIAGRRNSYLNPIKMYVFTSAIFFLIFFSVYSMEDTSNTTFDENGKDITNQIKSNKEKQELEAVKDSLAVLEDFVPLVNDSLGNKKNKKKNNRNVNFSFGSTQQQYSTVEKYDSAQAAMPDSLKDGWALKLLNRKAISLNQKYDGQGDRIGVLILNKFMHSFPYILFVSLPLYALFLKLIYIRHKRKFFADHGIFLVHLYIFTFILLLIFIGLGELGDLKGFNWMSALQVLLILFGIWYAFKAMRNFYGQGFGKTFLKFIVFNILCLVSINLLFAIFLLVTFFQV
jgi:hypothetical protein